jgi:hypothetical protein
MPYTGGDIKRSGELGKMFDIPADGTKSRKSGPIPGAPSRSGSFAGTAQSGPGAPMATGRMSGSLASAGSVSMKKTNSGPLSKHGEPLKKSSGPQSGGVTRQNSGSIPILPATGLITSGPITSGPLNSSGAPRKVSGPLDSSGLMKSHMPTVVHNQAVTTLGPEDDFSCLKSFPKPVLWLVVLIFIMGFLAGGFILGAVHNPILLVVVAILFTVVAALFIWNICWGRRGITDFIARYPDADLRTAKNGQHVKVAGVSIHSRLTIDCFLASPSATCLLARMYIRSLIIQ